MINNILAPCPTNPYARDTRPPINEDHFREWVERKVGREHSRHMQPDEWTCLEAEYRKEYGLA